jgi:hypothetical protein
MTKAVLFAATGLLLTLIPLSAQPNRRPKLVVTDTNGNVFTLQPTAGHNNGSDDGTAAAGKDTGVFGQSSGDWKNHNFGSDNFLYVTSSTCNDSSGAFYLQFSLAGMPVQNIASAKIQVLAWNHAFGQAAPFDPVFGMRRVTSPWNEATLMFYTQPGWDAALIDQQAFTGVAGKIETEHEFWLNFDVTNLYKGWADNSIPNYGVRITHENAWCLNRWLAIFFTSDDGISQVIYTGAVTGDYGEPAVVSGKLIERASGNPIAGRTLTFTMGSLICSGVTDAGGQASCSIALNQGAGPKNITVSFAGDQTYPASNATAQFTITPGQTNIQYTGDTTSIRNGAAATLSAVLLQQDAVPIGGRAVQLTLGTGSSAQMCLAAVTDSTGRATCAIATVNQPVGPCPITAAFPGDSNYMPASVSLLVDIAGVTDTTPPAITPTLTGTLGAGGWYTSDVTVSWSVSDPETGIVSKTGCDTVTLAASGSVTCSATNGAGAGLTASVPLVIQIDKTPPIIPAPTISGNLGANGWYTGNVTVNWNVSDPESGLSGDCQAQTFNGSGAATCTATNRAGLTASAPPLVVKIDRTPPLIADPVIVGTRGANGWYTSDVTVSWNVSDSESSVASSTGCGPITLAAGATLTCSATNAAGLTASSAPLAIQIDKAPPIISGMPGTGCSLWPPNNKLVQVATISAPAGLSGTVAFDVTGSSNEPAESGPDIVITGSGLQPRVVQLRAQRLGSGNGRIYTLTATTSNGAGATKTVTTTCTVSHDQGK